MTMVNISDCCYYNINLLCFCNEIGWHDLQFRQVSGKIADCAEQFANWQANLQIGLVNLQNGQIGRNRCMYVVCYVTHSLKMAIS